MNSKDKYEFKEWEKFFLSRKIYPKWPNETLTRLIYGNFLKKKITLSKKSKILDIGCGFGNNFTIFKNFNSKLYGTEISKNSAKKIKDVLKKRGINTDIREGTNRNLPFDKNFFDLVLSLNVIQYERNYENLISAIKEYRRVMKKNANIIIISVAPKHYSYLKGKKIKKNIYYFNKWHHIKNQIFFYFENISSIKKILRPFFKNIEVGLSYENLMGTELEYFLIKAVSK